MCRLASMRVWALWTLLGLVWQTDVSRSQRCGNNLMYCPGNNTCMHTSLLCDGKVDCPSGLDESDRYCDASCPSSTFACAVNNCIPANRVCQETRSGDCADQRDEEAALCGIQFACGGGLIGAGLIQSPNYPYKYPNYYRYCQWTIEALPITGSIALEFEAFSTEFDNDLLSIYTNSQHEIFRFSGTNAPSTVILGSQATITFDSNGILADKGFSIRFSTREKAYSACSRNLFGSGLIQSPNYPSSYSNNLNCTWTFQRSPNTGSIVVGFEAFQTDYERDILDIYSERTLVNRFSGTELPQSFTLQGEMGTAEFTTDDAGGGTGFSMAFTTIGCVGSYIGEGFIQSPNYPHRSNYSNNLNCTWKLQTSSPTAVISLDLWYLDAEFDHDFLYIYSRTTLVHRLTGHHTRQTFQIDSETTVKFTTDGSGVDLGFVMRFETRVARTRCGENFIGSGLIQSPNYPSNYSNNMDCLWMLQASPATGYIEISIQAFSTEPDYDFLEIYNDNVLFYKFSGSSVLSNFILSNQSTVKFTTDSSLVSAGFSIRFVTINNGCCQSSTPTFESVPCAPTGLNATARTSSSITVVWLPPSCPNGVILGYFVCQSANGTDSRVCISVGATTTMQSLTSLLPYTSYNISVLGYTTTGNGSEVSIVSQTAEAEVDVYCHSKIVELSSKRNVTLPKIHVRTSISLPCFVNKDLLLNASCLLSKSEPPVGVYNHTILNPNCQDEISYSTPRLGDLSLEPVTGDSIVNITQEVGSLTNTSNDLQPADIRFTATIIQNLAGFVNSSKNSAELLQQVSTLVTTVISNIMDANETVLREARKTDLLVSSIVRSFDEILLKTAESLRYGHLLPDSDPSLVISKNLAYQVTSGRTLAGISQCKVGNETTATTVAYDSTRAHNCSNASIEMARITLSNISSGLPRTYAVYRNSSLFNDGAAPDTYVLSAQLSGELPHSSFGGDLVTVRQKIDQVRVTQDFMLVCGYWNFSESDWDLTGCTTRVEDSSGDLVCTCSHLTNFAVLVVQRDIGSDHDIILSYISIIFLSISSIALLFVIITFFTFKKLRQSDSTRLTTCLSTSLLCVNLLFIFGIQATSDEDTCASIAVTLHYFLLTSFMFMTAEAILHYLRLVKIFDAHVKNFIWKVSSVSLGIPAIVVIACRFGDPSLYGKGSHYQYCWVQRSLQIYGFIVPISGLICINIVIFALIVRALTARQKLRSSISEKRLTRMHTKALASIFVVLGITWVFGFLAHIEGASVVFQYMFNICNSLQGLLIFIFHNLKAPFILSSLKTSRVNSRKTDTTTPTTNLDSKQHNDLSLSTSIGRDTGSRSKESESNDSL